VPIGRKARRCSGTLPERGPAPARDPAFPANVFITKRGTPSLPSPSGCASSSALGELGIPRNVTPHMFAAQLATHLLDPGAICAWIQELLGHASISTTEVYTHVAASRLRDVHRKYHPRP